MVAFGASPIAAESKPNFRYEDRHELTQRVDSKTFRQVRDLHIDLESGRIILRGHSQSYYVKQLATLAIQNLLPGAAIDNAISVGRLAERSGR